MTLPVWLALGGAGLATYIYLLLFSTSLVTEVTERMHTERSLESSRQELKRLASQLIRVQDEERRRISRDLHDDVNQRLALFAIELHSLEQQLPVPHRRTVTSLSHRIAELSEDVRRLAYDYHPSILDDLGLSIAMRRLVEDVASRSQIEAHIDCDPLPDGLSQEVATCIYRVAQESLGNIIRHARASRVEVELGRSSMGLTLSIADNGVGFHADPLHSDTGGLGLLSMKERVSLVGGTLRIESAVGTGTRVQALIPLAETEI